MLNRVTFILAAVCTLTLSTLAGCVKTYDPAPEQDGSIRFGAGSLLLNDDATKGIPKEGTTFSVGDAFVAWAWHAAANQHFSFGTTSPVTLGAEGWDYDPHQYWNWGTGSDFYDFLAVYPAGKEISHTAATSESPLLRASIAYDATADQYDLMAAGRRRTDKSIGTVDLTFQHLLSAVAVKVTNSENSVSGSYPLTVTLKSCKFKNLITDAPITVTFDGTQLVTSASGGRGEEPVLGPTINNTALAPGVSYPTLYQWDLMVPQDLNPDGSLLPTLEIVYNKGDATDVREEVVLKDILNKVSGAAITQWRAGYKYVYEIELRIGVGIMVKVTTTPWEVIEAETPGLMI